VDTAPAVDDAVDAEALWADIADPAVFTEAYVRFRLPVYRYLRARGATDEDALDLTAVTFERAYANRDAFRPRDGGLRAWLLRIARNAAIDAHRRRRPERSLVDHDDSIHSMDGGDEHAQQDLRDAVAGLPEVQRDAIWLRYAGGLTAREIGRVLGMSDAAAQKQIQRGLESLREALR
jgi:RNA polymerase sigma-70 factor (ECF subfamily)